MAMNKRQAFAHARKLWGKQAGVYARNETERLYSPRCWVGSQTYACNDGKGKVNVHGNGYTWEAAFSDAKHCYKYWENQA